MKRGLSWVWREGHRAAAEGCDWLGRGSHSPGWVWTREVAPGSGVRAEESTSVRPKPAPTESRKGRCQRVKQEPRLAGSVTRGMLVGPRESPCGDTFHLRPAGPLEGGLEMQLWVSGRGLVGKEWSGRGPPHPNPWEAVFK